MINKYIKPHPTELLPKKRRTTLTYLKLRVWEGEMDKALTSQA